MTSPICGPCLTCSDCVPKEPPEPRGSVMPAHMQPIDPLFSDAIFNEFEPDEWALLEKGVRG